MSVVLRLKAPCLDNHLGWLVERQPCLLQCSAWNRAIVLARSHYVLLVWLYHMSIPEWITMCKVMRGNEWFKPRSYVPPLSQGWVNSTQRHELRVGKETVISQRELGVVIKMRGIEAGQQKQQIPTKRLQRQNTVLGLKIAAAAAAAAVGGQRNCLGTFWAGACELLIPHGHSCGFNYLYPSSTFHLRRCSVNLAKWNQKEQRKGREGRRRCQLRKVLIVSELWYRQVCCALQLSS